MKTSELRKTPAEILHGLGITRPDEIDIDVIAYTCGATTRDAELTGCEAALVGKGDKAIITVRRQSSQARRRFSIGHELGHWMRDRGNVSFSCRKSDVSAISRGRERRANEFASELLLPAYLFDPLAQDRSLDLETVRDLADTFRTSSTATAIKLVRRGSYPAVLASYKRGRREWFIPSDTVPSAFTPLESLEQSTGTANAHGTAAQGTGDICADRWFAHENAGRYYIRESWFRTTSDSVVVLLWWEDEDQLLDFDDEEQDYEARRERTSWDPFE